MLAKEGFDLVARNRRNSEGQRACPHGRRELDLMLRCTGDIRHAICPKQIQLIARINEVRVIEVWVALPQIGPAPGITEK